MPLILLMLACDFLLPAAVPKIDKARLESYVRYVESFTAQVKMTTGDPESSAYPGYFRVVVRLSVDNAPIGERILYTADGEHFLNGQLWALGKNPFLETLEHLPADGASFGPADAKVTMVVFSDFECPYCREFAKTLRTNLVQKYPNDVRVVFEEFPIQSIHPWAVAAAQAAECLRSEKPAAFWAFHDWIFDNQGEVNAANLKEKTLNLAKEQGIDTGKVAACIDSHATAGMVNADIEKGRELQVQQTPTSFVNGRTVGGALPWKSIDGLIQLELNRPKDIPGSPAEKCCAVPVPSILKK